MKKAFLVSISIILLALPAFSQAPKCLFQDNLSGPASGGESGNGTYVVLRGKNFGAMQGGSNVTVNGKAPAQYFNWDAADVTGNYETIGLQVASGTTGAGAIVVTTAAGSCQYSTATITGLSIFSGVATLSYEGPPPAAGQLVYIQGLTSEAGAPLNARNYAVLSTGLSSGQFQISVPNAPNAGATSDNGTAGNGGFTVTSGKLYYVGSNVDKSTPGSCAAMKSANSYRSPWGLTSVANIDTFAQSENAYNYLQQRTPYTYYNCLTAGDTLVFLNGVDFPYGDGTSEHTSFFMGGPNGSAGNPITFMARPGATVTFGGPDTVNYGLRGGTATYLNFYNLNLIGSAVNGEALDAGTTNRSGPNMRLVGNTAQCPDCWAAAADVSGGWNASLETNTAPTGLVLYGNWAYNASCLTAGGISNKEYHFIYINGNGAEVGWNKVGGTGPTAGCAQNGIQMNYYQDNSIGYGNFSVHDNDVSYANGSGINMATIDPSQGPINIYNNVVHHTGLQPASDGGSFFSCITFPGYSPSAGAGTANVFNNTCWDTSYELNTSSIYSPTSCAIYISNDRQPNLTVNLVNNIIAQPAYSYTGTRNENVYLCGSGVSQLTGSKNIFYSASAPWSTSPASKLTSLAVPTNPMFMKAADGPLTNFQLQGTSQAIGTGSILLHSMMDISGVTRPMPPSVGAFEHASDQSSDQISLSVSPNPATIEEPITLTATVAQTGTSIPTGTVDFLNGSNSLGQASLNGEGTATVVVASLPAGDYAVVASYSGDANYPARVSGEVSLAVQSATATSLVATPNPVVAGQPLLLTTTVEGSGQSAPAGTVSFLSGSTVLGTATLNSSGTAVLSTIAPSSGTYTLTAQYAGDASFLASTAPALSLKVTAAAQSTATTLVADPNSLIVGQTVTLTASVKGSGTTTPAGTVSFLNGVTPLGTGILNSSGVATLSTSALAAGKYNLTAKYAGNVNSEASTSAAVSVTVTAAVQSTTTTLFAAPNPVTTGQALTLTASVKGSGTTVPAGAVSFLNGVTLLGTGTLNSSGVATFSISAPAPGNYNLTAKYTGNANSDTSTSAAVSLTVTAAVQSTATTLVANPNSLTVGQAVTLTASVKGSGTITPAGTVSFLNGVTLLGVGTLNSSGVATFSTSALAAGKYNLTAKYAGNANSDASTSAAASVTVTAAVQSTTTTLVAAPNPVTAGQTLTLTASVKGSGTITPIGTVSFLNGPVVLGTGTLNSSGVATLSSSALAAAKYSLTAQYAGNADSLKSTSAPVSVTVTAPPESTTTSLAASASAVTIGHAVAITATVHATGTTKLAGSIIFLSGGTVLGTVALNASGAATFSTTSLGVGKYSFSAKYIGNQSFSSSTSPAVSVSVKAQETTTGLVASPNPAIAGQALTLTATVKGASPATPAGQVVFMNGATELGTATLNTSGVATLRTSIPASGNYQLMSAYAGNAVSFSSKSAVVSVTVTAKAQSTSTSLSASPNSVTLGQAVALTATVNANGATKPAGSVTFMNGNTVLGTGVLNASGVATLSTTSLAMGKYSLSAEYAGSAGFLTSNSAAVSVEVTAQGTTTSLLASPNPVVAGQALSLTATVKGSGTALPAGIVTFLNGSAQLGTATLNSSGVATLSTTSLAAGTYSLTALYTGSATSLTSTSSAVSVTITPAAQSTTITLAAAPNPVTAGQTLTLTATVNRSGISDLNPKDASVQAVQRLSQPTGTVSFMNGFTLLGTGTLNPSGVATLSTSSLAAGTYSFTALYAGSVTSLASTSSAVSLTVMAAEQSTTTALAAALNPDSADQTLTLTATVNRSGITNLNLKDASVEAVQRIPQPNGTVSFKNGPTLLGTGTLNPSGVATLSAASLAPGTYSLTAEYSGSSSFLPSTSTAVSVTVNAGAAAIVRGFLLNPPESSQAETRQPSGSALCRLAVPASDSQPGATVTYLSEDGSCGQRPASQ